MFKGSWLRLNNHHKKLKSKTGLFILIGLILFYSLGFSLHASSSISVEKILQLAQSHQGDAQKRFRAWARLIEGLKNKPDTIQLEQVNAFFNQFNYQSDLETEGVEDYWKSPEEFVVDGGGDCEDFAIIKYFTLAALGIPEENLRITYVTSSTIKQAHMVLSYYPSPEAEPLILDSLEPAILKASRRPDLKPVYSFNASGLWLAKQRGQSSLMGQPNSLGKWGELMKRMQE
jgi:predicted transglutaminase-like cysteine proteinase